MRHFRDRYHAGSLLARTLESYRAQADTLVFGIPRGGVPVAYEVAKFLSLPLDVFLVRKLGVPGQEELAMGAISSGGGQVLNVPLVDALGIPRRVIEETANRERKILEQRQELYQKSRPPLDPRQKTVILIDDGLATGSTMLAGIDALRHLNPKRIVVAVPVASAEASTLVQLEADEWHCLSIPEPFYAVGQWYDDFEQVDDKTVTLLLQTGPVKFTYERTRGIS